MNMLAPLVLLILTLIPTQGFAERYQDSDPAARLALPEPIEQCGSLVLNCFSKGDSQDIETSNCLYTSANHPFCLGTRLGKIVYQRWLMSPVRSVGLEEHPENLLGPKLVDTDCLAKFDNFFMSSLVKSSQLDETVSILTERLESCARVQDTHLTRP